MNCLRRWWATRHGENRLLGAATVLAVLAASAAAADNGRPSRSLLVACYRAGDLSRLGLYTWDERIAQLKTLRVGARGCARSRDGLLLAYEQNSNLWFRQADGREYIARMAGLLGPGSRRFQFLAGSQRGVALVREPFGDTVCSWVDVARCTQTNDTPSPFQFVKPWPGCSARALRAAAGVRQESVCSVLAHDICTSSADAIAVAARCRVGAWLSPRSWIAAWVVPDQPCRAVPGATDTSSDETPYWLDPNTTLAFDRTDTTSGRRRTMRWDLKTGAVVPIVVRVAGQASTNSTWLLGVDAEHGQLVLGEGVAMPTRLIVCTYDGTAKWTATTGARIWSATLSPDGTQVAFVTATGSLSAEPFETSLTHVFLERANLADQPGNRRHLITTDWGDDRRDDPLVPYALWW